MKYLPIRQLAIKTCQPDRLLHQPQATSDSSFVMLWCTSYILLQNLMAIQNYLAITYPYITCPLKVNSCFNSLMLALITLCLKGTSPRISTTGNKIYLKWDNCGDKTTPLPHLLKLRCLLFCTDTCSLNSGTTQHGRCRGRKALFSLFLSWQNIKCLNQISC